MNIFRNGRQPRLVLILVALAIAWWNFSPFQLGGRTAYAIIDGNSMEPGLHPGDLVILRRTADYQPGEVVAYRNPEIGIVIHRVVGKQAGRFSLKGDNNLWQDSYHPDITEIIGKSWLHFPTAGKGIEKLRQPQSLALISIYLGLAVAATVVQTETSRRPRRKRKKRPTQGGIPTGQPPALNQAELLLAFGIVALAALALCVFVFLRPVQRAADQDLTFQHSGVFRYSARVSPGVYDSQTIQTGEPVFTRLACKLDLEFDYAFNTDLPHELEGTRSLKAELSDANGWKRSMELVPSTGFSGDRSSLRGQIDLCQVQALIDEVSQKTLIRQQGYDLSVIPDIRISGSLGDQELKDRFAPALIFQLDPYLMKLSKDSGEAGNPLRPVQVGMLKGTRIVPNALSVLGIQLRISTLRWVCLLALVFSLGGVALIGVPMLRAWKVDDASRLRIKYAAWMVDVGEDPFPAGSTPVDLLRMDDLARMAEKYGTMILHETLSSGHAYWVQDGNALYRYRLVTPDDLSDMNPETEPVKG